MSGPDRRTVTRKETIDVCPLCDHEVTGYNHLKNGTWVFEAVENFGITDPDEGMVCMEWGSEHVWMYYHSPETLEKGETPEWVENQIGLGELMDEDGE